MENRINVLEAIAERLNRCSKGQKKIGEYLLVNYAAAAYMTAAKLSETVGVSESTIVRYATELGFEGYPELQSALRYAARSKLTSVERMKLSKERIGEDTLQKSVNSDIESIKKTLAMTDKAAFDGFVTEIMNAERIYIVGARSSASLAMFLNFYLSILFDNVQIVHTVIGSEAYDQMFKVKKGDVVLGITFPRYSKLTVDVLGFSKRAGATVLGITDSIHSPIAKTADITLFADNESDTFVDSLAAPLTLINALLVEIGRRDPERTATRFDILERIWAENDVYDNL
ncbi:MAG: MurR/RpiR family transcriptional regulator [Clostridia bacterium]|nr:MurR/RpiR family transcriptional regulator [Clostridia bacterium]MBQ9848298.1 MurR/RpiR family transcriptional regulator [Clostridia bacterium]